MSASLAYLVVDGLQTPAEDCVWVEYAACGCPCGAVLAARPGGRLNSTPEAARADLHEGVPGRRLPEGRPLRLMLLDTFRALPLGCGHDPKWGAPQPKVMTTNKLPASRRDNLDYAVDRDGDTVTVHVYAPIGDDGAVELNESDLRALLAAIERADQ